jgi:TonB family protein
MKFATSCWLLVALTATTALAQTHPKQQPSREPASRQQVGRTRQQLAEDAFIQNTYEGLDQHTQPATLDPIYTYVERMPTLNGQHALFASTAAITHAVVVPADAPEGRVFVQFVVTRAGTVSQPHVVKGLRADVDSAVVAATRKLPRFTPGKQNGRVVAVCLTLPVTFPVKKEQP